MASRAERLTRTAATIKASTLAIMTIAVATIWAFFEILDEVIEGGTHALDRALLAFFRVPGEPSNPIGPAWVEEMMRDFTALGGVGVLTFITGATAGFHWLKERPRSALLIILTIGSSLLLVTCLKLGVDRPRPDLVPTAIRVYTASFPSGHSTMATVTYLTLATQLAQIQRRVSIRIYLFALAVLMIILVGISRVYLGVHWPSDVLAGWTLGAAWTSMFWLVAQFLKFEDGPGHGTSRNMK